MKWDIAQLPWLPAPAADFRGKCRTAGQLAADQGRAFSILAGGRLTNDQLVVLSKAIRGAARAGNDLSPLVPFRLAVLGNATTCLFVTTLEASGARHGLNLEIVQASYDQVVQEALDPTSTVNASRPDAVLLALDYRALPLQEGSYGDCEKEEAAVGAAMEHIAMIRDALRKGCGAPVIYQTVPQQPISVFGNFSGGLCGTHRSMVSKLNDRLRNLAASSSDYLLDIAALAENVGLNRWHDPVQWNLYKLPFSQALVPLYSDHVARLIASIRGRSRKCLVLDLDNVLWGGVIGDDGVEGIQLGQGSGLGEAFLDIQRMALLLRQRGIVLAVCSRNDEKNAREPFRVHPEMLLKDEHLAAFRANWQDKATNIESIAQELNLGLDSLVFLDDDPFQRAQVRMALPMVAVPELPEDPSYYPHALLAAGYFETVSHTREDALRADQYLANVRRSELLASGRDLSEYLRSLSMEIQFDRFDSVNRPRIVQLINKTNQFNVTTKRYTEADVAGMESAAGEYATLQVRVKDSFGDHGMIGVVICRIDGESWDIDTWLMSCRVFGRCVEFAVLNELARKAIGQGARELVGHYMPTRKNDLVKDLFRSLGFAETARQDDGTTRWRLLLEGHKPFATPFVNVV